MTYNVFSGTLNPAQSINPGVGVWNLGSEWESLSWFYRAGVRVPQTHNDSTSVQEMIGQWYQLDQMQIIRA